MIVFGYLIGYRPRHAGAPSIVPERKETPTAVPEPDPQPDQSREE
jgi:hypothetical protein